MNLWQILSSFPSNIPSVLLGILLVYWLLAIIGLVDHGDNLEIDTSHAISDIPSHHDLHLDHQGAHQATHHNTEPHTLAGYLVAMGLGGVPFSIVVTLLTFFTWLLTALIHQYFIALIPTSLLKIALGTGTLLFSAAISIMISARLIKPMRGLFVKHNARSNHSLVGLSCRIVTQTVDEKFGRAEVQDGGSNINIRVWASTPNTLTKNSFAVILDYDGTSLQYEVQAVNSTN